MGKRGRFFREISVFLAIVSCVSLLFTACSDRAEETETGLAEEGVRNGREEGEYTFQDAEGNEYEAPLLENVPECTYDLAKIETDGETGFKTFHDEEGGVTARFGIDVSEFQGEEIDWDQVKESGVEFVIVRLGYRAYGDTGDLVLDAMYEQNVRGALDAGLDVGVYFFSQAVTAAEAVEEAEFVLRHLKPYEITGPVVYDTEEIKWGAARTDGNTDKDFTNFCKVFCDTVRQKGYEPMIYSNMKWMAFTLDMEELTEYDFWYADYHDTPQCPYDFEIWQYSENGAVPGINANVNLNLWFQKENGQEDTYEME